MEAKNVDYRWPDLSPVRRQYVVVDDQGRFGIAYGSDEGTIWARPIGKPVEMPATPEMGLPGNAIIMTSTSWRLEPSGTYRGWWYDDNVPTFPATVPEEMIRHLTIVDDLGIIMPDRWTDIALAGSDEMGHWNYGATLGRTGGEPPIKGQKPDEMTVEQAADYAREVGETISRRGIRLAARNGYIPSARKIGRDWLITYDGFNNYLDNRPRRGPKPKSSQ